MLIEADAAAAGRAAWRRPHAAPLRHRA
jgi:hypothetical protein